MVRRTTGLQRPEQSLLIVVLVLSLGDGPTADAVPAPREIQQGTGFSLPLWYPLRERSQVSCVRTNCDGPYHGYWAIDWLGDLGDPVHAAGSGIAHIGAVSPGCSTDHPRAGTWVWIDHGGGTVSRYFHLDAIHIDDGQWVTPRTRIGSMGHSGAKAPCGSGAYLHFEVRRGGLAGDTIAIGALAACSDGSRRSFPSALGYDNWDDGPRYGQFVPAGDSSCVPTSFPASPAPTNPAVAIGDAEVSVSWTPPDGAIESVVYLEIYRPTKSAFARLEMRYVSGSTSTTRFVGLLNGRDHRVTVASATTDGWSTWTSPLVTTPGRRPDAPVVPRSLTWSRNRISLGWYRSVRYGYDTLGYDVAIRRRTGAATWGPWIVTSIGNDSFYRFTPLPALRTYEMKVRARSVLGASPWSKTVTAQTISA